MLRVEREQTKPILDMLSEVCEIISCHPWLAILFALVIFQVTRASYRLTLHPLAKFPGPRIAAATRWYEIWYEIILGGRFAHQIDTLHMRYGPIVRINPFEVHISDPGFYDTLYNLDRRLEKRDYHIQNVQHTGPCQPHQIRRRGLAPFLNPRAIQELEPLITFNISQLCLHLSKAQESGNPIVLSHLYRCMTADIISTYTFGESYELLKNASKSESFLQAFQVTFRLLWLLREIPYLSTFVRWLGIAVGSRLTGPGIIPTLLRWQLEIDVQLQGLKDSRATSYPSLLSSYIARKLPAGEKISQPLHDTAIMLLAAGFETTGFTLTTATYHILSSPSILHRLQQELHTHIPSCSAIPPWKELEKLPYLSGIINESLRLSLGASAQLPRVNEEKDVWYKEYRIPKGTAISMTHADLHYNETFFPEPKRFKPERWLGAEAKGLERWLVSFSRGGRSCLGVHLAHAELYLTLATLFRKYDMRLFDTRREDVEPARDFFVPAPEPGGSGLRITVQDSHDDTWEVL